MTRPRVAVLDYGSGNIHSAVRALEHAGADVVLSADRDVIAGAAGLVVPGVGAFASVMESMQRVSGDQIIRERHAAGLSVLGICVGMQVLFSFGTEHGATTPGVGLWEGSVERLDAEVVPHMGWSQVTAPRGSRMFEGINDQHFYFVHTYAAPHGPTDALITTSSHGSRFTAAVEDGATWATQFHPEKSGEAGQTLLSNWVHTLNQPHPHPNLEEQE